MYNNKHNGAGKLRMELIIWPCGHAYVVVDFVVNQFNYYMMQPHGHIHNNTHNNTYNNIHNNKHKIKHNLSMNSCIFTKLFPKIIFIHFCWLTPS